MVISIMDRLITPRPLRKSIPEAIIAIMAIIGMVYLAVPYFPYLTNETGDFVSDNTGRCILALIGAITSSCLIRSVQYAINKHDIKGH